MSFFFPKPPSPPPPPPLPPPVSDTNQQAQKEAEGVVKLKKRAIARSRTIFTSATGLKSQADTFAKTLLGQ